MIVELKRWEEADAEELALVLNNPKVMNNLRDGLPYPYTREAALLYIHQMLEADPEATFAFAITLDGKVIGSIGAFRQGNIHYRTAEMGYYVGEDYWGKGVMTQAVSELCKYIFSNTDIVRIYAEPFSYNIGSCRVLEKNGFRLEGIMKNNAYKNKHFIDMKLYAKTKNIIHIYGASGAGTSTLGRKICEELGYTFMDTDDYFWLPTDPKYTEKRDKAERIKMMRKDIAQAENVVISGSLSDWGDELIPLFTLAVRVVTDTNVRLERLQSREYAEFKERILPGGDMYTQHLEFLEWASKYDTGDITMRSKKRHDVWEQKLGCSLIVLDGTADLFGNVRIIEEHL